MAATTQQVLDHHLKAFGAGDLDGILEDFAEDSVVFTPDGLLRSPGERRSLFETARSSPRRLSPGSSRRAELAARAFALKQRPRRAGQSQAPARADLAQGKRLHFDRQIRE
jgi:hypothetical protein